MNVDFAKLSLYTQVQDYTCAIVQNLVDDWTNDKPKDIYHRKMELLLQTACWDLRRWKLPTISVLLDFLKCVQIFTFLQNANLYSVYRFALLTRKSRLVFFTYRFAFWRTGKCGHTCKNLDRQKLLGVSSSGWNSGRRFKNRIPDTHLL